MKETRAVILGLVVVVLVALGLSLWKRPSRDLRRVRGFHVEIQKTENGSRRHVSFTVPVSLVARLATLAPVSDIGGSRADWNDAELTAKDILDAADKSTPGQPGVITKNHARIEVTSEGAALNIFVKDDWDKTVRIRLPRALVERFSRESRISPRDVLKKLDDLGPGDIVSIHDRDADVTITAEGR